MIIMFIYLSMCVCTHTYVCEHLSQGEDCNTNSCEECRPCLPGYFKSAIGTDACEQCPANTYRDEPGARELSNCVQCLAKSSTRQKRAQSTWRACVCDSIYYKLVSEQPSDECQKCPPGAREEVSSCMIGRVSLVIDPS